MAPLRGKAALHRRPHARVLVHGASGGIGCYGVQLATLDGAHVTVVAGGAKLGFVSDLGADEVIDHREQDITRLAALVDGGRPRVPVDRTFPLAQIAAAHRHAETAVRGKVVVTI